MPPRRIEAYPIDECEVVPPRWSERHPWLHQFTAVGAGVLVAGMLLGLGLRWYVQWSVAGALQSIQNKGR